MNITEEVEELSEDEGEQVFVGNVTQEDIMGMKFEVCGVTKALAAVWRIVDQGNDVIFSKKRSFIKNNETGKELNMRSTGKSWVIDVNFVKLSETGARENLGKGIITVDSGAEESVCPQSFGANFAVEGLNGNGMNLVDASGGKIDHWGTRKVTFTKPTF